MKFQSKKVDLVYKEPEVEARKIRSAYLWPFAPVAVCVAVAALNILWHEWMYGAVFAFSALIYAPLALHQYRSAKLICEKAIVDYQQWYQENHGGLDL
ncbi:hypothetical protein EON83_25145 [bacterium]|nr:MAG: hypothetical protein EON83_25145 [bacterium]